MSGPRPGEMYALSENDYKYGEGPIVARNVQAQYPIQDGAQPWWKVSLEWAPGTPTNHGGWRSGELLIRDAALPAARYVPPP